MLEPHLPRRVEHHIDDRPLRRREQHLVNEGLRSYRPLSPPTSFIRAPGTATLKIRVFAVFTR